MSTLAALAALAAAVAASLFALIDASSQRFSTLAVALASLAFTASSFFLTLSAFDEFYAMQVSGRGRYCSIRSLQLPASFVSSS